MILLCFFVLLFFFYSAFLEEKWLKSHYESRATRDFIRRFSQMSNDGLLEKMLEEKEKDLLNSPPKN